MKGKTKRVLQVLSIAVGSALVCVPASQLLFGDNIVSALVGGLIAVYLTARLVAAITEKDVNGKLNIFAAVFATLLTLLALTGLEKTYDPSYAAPVPSVEGVEEPTGSAVPSGAVTGTEPSSTGYDSSAVEESSPLVPSSQSSPSSSLPLEGEEEQGSVPSVTVEGTVPAGEESSPSLHEEVSVPSSPVFVTSPSTELVETEERTDTESSEVTLTPASTETAGKTETPEITVQTETAGTAGKTGTSEITAEAETAEKAGETETLVPFRVPAAPVFVSSVPASTLQEVEEEAGKSPVRVPAAPVFVTAEPEAEIETVEGEAVEAPKAEIDSVVVISDVTVSAPAEAGTAESAAAGEVKIPEAPSGSSITVTQVLVEVEDEETAAVVPVAAEETSSDETAETAVRVPAAPVFVTGGTSAALVPDVPSFAFSEPSAVLVPEAPVFKPVSQTLYEVVETPVVAVEEEEEDPWADFYFSDEDLALEDGIYYFSLYVNDYLEGDIEVEVLSGEVLVSAYELEAYISGYLEEESADRIFRNEEEYYSMDYLTSVGLDAWADTSFFEYYLYLSSGDMPVTRISIKGNSSRSVTRPISGAVTVNPVTAYMISSYSLSASTTITKGKGFFANLHYSLSSSNSVRLWDVFGSFSWSLSGSGKDIAFNWGSYSFFQDYEDLELRLRFGNVSSDSFSPTGTPIGIRIDKSSSYGSSTTKKRNDQKEILVEKDSDVVVYNQEREIYRKTLKAGRYILEDFVLYSGSNEIKIVITPLDGSAETVETFTIKYSSSLLQPGEAYWGAAFAFSRQKVDSSSERLEGQVDLPFLFGKKLRYDITDFSASAYLNIGILDSLSGNVQVAMKGKRGDYAYKVSAEFTNLNALGTLKANVNYSYANTSSLYVRLSEQFTITNGSFLRGITLSASYNKSNLRVENGYTVTPSVALSGAVGIVSWSVGASGTLLPYSWSTSTWMVTPSLSVTLGKISLSFSSTLSGVGSGSFSYSGRLSASMRIGGVSTVASTGGKDTSVSASYSHDSFSLSGRIRTNDIRDWKQYSYGVDFSSSTSLFSYSASLSSSGSFESISLNGNMGFSSVFANGLFAFASSVPSSFMLIKQKGALKGNTVSVATAGSSESTVPSGYIGNILYRGLPSSGASNISIYSQNDTGFSSGSSFDIFIPDTKNRGYVVTLEGESTYTLSGTVSVGDYIWRNGSSPLYTAEIDDDGVVTLTQTEEYAFTDSNGIFILSDLGEGTYGFDVRADNKWYLYLVTVTDDLNPNLVTMVTEKTSSALTAPEVYEGVIETMNEREITADEFWAELYGEV